MGRSKTKKGREGEREKGGKGNAKLKVLLSNLIACKNNFFERYRKN
jgi:hypothetical protein